ncbi:BlaI/MecI/CopY family transcriptional regulator [Ornithinimicrobium sp. Y1847]|uniref:BlaI/MecI/CopY family transcriptional regulator n=1 Tax=Ornithinimicrobium sp. Y1847 TaxID=3405419 RepID=UPI003B672BB8
MRLRTSSLGDLERTVMDALWSHGPDLSVREVMDTMEASGSKELAYTTVMTVLDRLAKKGIATRTRDGRAWRYTAASSREELAGAALRSTLDGVQADRRLAMMHFLSDASPAELEDLRAALADVEAKHT